MFPLASPYVANSARFESSPLVLGQVEPGIEAVVAADAAAAAPASGAAPASAAAAAAAS